MTLIANIKISGGSTHLNLLKWLKKLSSFDNQSALTSCTMPAIFGSSPHESTMLTTSTPSHINKNDEDASVSAIKLITDDLNSGSWGPSPTKKLKNDCTAAILKYSVWIADPAFTCKVFNPPEPCFVLASDKGICMQILHTA